MLIEIEKIKVKDRIRKDFGDIQELADDIKENGLINPPVVTPDTFELIAGERRLRAMELLGYKQIEVRPMSVKDAEHQLNLEISENETRKDFSKKERIEYAKRLRVIEEIKAKEKMSVGGQGGFSQGSENFHNLETGRTSDIVATKLNVGSGRQLEKEEYIVENQSNLSPTDFADWDEGKLSTNKAFLKIKEQLKEKDNIITGYEIKLASIKETEKNQKLIMEQNNLWSNRASELEFQIDQLQVELSSRPTIEKEIKPNDYDSNKNLLNGIQKDYVSLEARYNSKVKELNELKIDPELRDFLPPLTEEEFKQLEKNILRDGKLIEPIWTWKGYIVDGQNRHKICTEHNITVPHDYMIALAYETKEEIFQWMIDTQLGRRNLTTAQKIAIAEKYRAVFERKARENQSLAGGDKKAQDKIDTTQKLADIAGVGKETYRMGAKIFNSGNESLKQEVLSGKKKISAGYNELNEKLSI